jgi:hypothetical protein
MRLFPALIKVMMPKAIGRAVRYFSPILVVFFLSHLYIYYTSKWPLKWALSVSQAIRGLLPLDPPSVVRSRSQSRIVYTELRSLLSERRRHIQGPGDLQLWCSYTVIKYMTLTTGNRSMVIGNHSSGKPQSILKSQLLQLVAGIERIYKILQSQNEAIPLSGLNSRSSCSKTLSS